MYNILDSAKFTAEQARTIYDEFYDGLNFSHSLYFKPRNLCEILISIKTTAQKNVNSSICFNIEGLSIQHVLDIKLSLVWLGYTVDYLYSGTTFFDVDTFERKIKEIRVSWSETMPTYDTPSALSEINQAIEPFSNSWSPESSATHWQYVFSVEKLYQRFPSDIKQVISYLKTLGTVEYGVYNQKIQFPDLKFFYSSEIPHDIIRVTGKYKEPNKNLHCNTDDNTKLAPAYHSYDVILSTIASNNTKPVICYEARHINPNDYNRLLEEFYCKGYKAYYTWANNERSLLVVEREPYEENVALKMRFRSEYVKNKGITFENIMEEIEKAAKEGRFAHSFQREHLTEEIQLQLLERGFLLLHDPAPYDAKRKYVGITVSWDKTKYYAS